MTSFRGRQHHVWAHRALVTGLASLMLFGVLYPSSGANSSPLAATDPGLGTAGQFSILGSTTVTNTGSTIITGDLGVSPGIAVTGFPPGIVNGTIHPGDATAAQARSDATTAFNNLGGQACDFNLTGQDLGGKVLVPGVYCFDTAAQLTGTLILNAQGNANAVFVFQIGSTLTTASSSSVLLINGGAPCRTFWRVGSSATLGTNTTFIGNILALASITLTTGTTIDSGRALALNGAVTLDSNVVTIANCAAQSSAPATAAAATATAAAAASATAAAGATATSIAQLPPATQTAIAIQTAIIPALTATAAAEAGANTPQPNNNEQPTKETEQRRRQRERTNNSNRDDYVTEGNVVSVACAQLTMTPTITPTVTVTVVTATATATPTRQPTATLTPTISIPVQVPAADDVDPAEAFSSDALALAAEEDTADIPYVVIATVDGEQVVRLLRDAKASCSSIRVGDYLEADGEKQHELLFDATDVTIRRAGQKVK